jgi:site-specific DNA recombinase
LYLRASTGRQAENDASLPSQRENHHARCMTNNWIVVDEHVAAATGMTGDLLSSK